MICTRCDTCLEGPEATWLHYMISEHPGDDPFSETLRTLGEEVWKFICVSNGQVVRKLPDSLKNFKVV